MSNDTIYRRDAIDAVWSLDVELRPSAIDAILNELNGLPTAEPRWIPVTERMPEKDGTYIVCLDDRSVFEYDYISKWWDDGAWQYCGKDVVAWMPLPDPWKGEEECC